MTDRYKAMRDGRCRHFNGIQHKTCDAGIALVSVRDASQPGPYRWPCLTSPGRDSISSACPKFSTRTAEELAAEEVEIAEAVAEFVGRRKRNLCLTCGAAATFETVGRCEYARPCGHRVGQVAGDEVDPLAEALLATARTEEPTR